MTKSQALGSFIGNSIGYATGALATSVIETSGSLATGVAEGYGAGRAGASWAELRAQANKVPMTPMPPRSAPIKVGRARATA
jgi:hypothetical protein